MSAAPSRKYKHPLTTAPTTSDSTLTHSAEGEGGGGGGLEPSKDKLLMHGGVEGDISNMAVLKSSLNQVKTKNNLLNKFSSESIPSGPEFIQIRTQINGSSSA